MLNVLFIAEDTSRLLNKTYYYLEKELAKNVNLLIWRKPGHIQSILSKIKQKPDFILLLNDIDRNFYPVIEGLFSINIPVGLFVNDVHRFTKIRKSYVIKQKIPYLFTVSRDTFLKLYPDFQHKMIWSPHFVQPDIFRDYKQKKDIDLLLMGAVNDYYPLRQKILAAYKGDPSFVYHQHPGYKPISGKKEGAEYLIEQRYAQEINRASIFFTCPSIYNYPVMKYFEALAAKSLLLAPTFPELEDLGFQPGKHFVSIDATNFQEKASYYLLKDKERQKITEQGYRFIHQTHTVQKRVKELVKTMENIIRS